VTFKPKPPPEELTAAFKSHLRSVPTAVVEDEPVTAQPPSQQPTTSQREGRRRKAPPVVQMNFNITEELADIITEEARKAGSTRRWLARLMKDAGYPVPDADLTPYMNVRRRRAGGDCGPARPPIL
jgi:hypothetical protein